MTEQFLDTEHISRSTDDVEWHPLRPFVPEGCCVLFLGSFPPPRNKWCMDFFYPNFINDHWRIEGQVFFGDKDYFVDLPSRRFRLDHIVPFLREKGIGLFDTATAVHRLRGNASDKFLEVVCQTDVAALIAPLTQLRVVVTTGEKATETLCEQLQVNPMPKVGAYAEIPHAVLTGRKGGGEAPVIYRLPSSSRAYPLSLDRKAEAYRQMFAFAGLL